MRIACFSASCTSWRRQCSCDQYPQLCLSHHSVHPWAPLLPERPFYPLSLCMILFWNDAEKLWGACFLAALAPGVHPELLRRHSIWAYTRLKCMRWRTSAMSHTSHAEFSSLDFLALFTILAQHGPQWFKDPACQIGQCLAPPQTRSEEHTANASTSGHTYSSFQTRNGWLTVLVVDVSIAA